MRFQILGFGIDSRSPYGALMFARGYWNSSWKVPPPCVHDVFDVPDIECNFEREASHTEYQLNPQVIRYWCYNHKRLNDSTTCDVTCLTNNKCKLACWGGNGSPPGSTRCRC